MSDHRLRINMEGVIELLARNLYADPDVFVREMIQNAHDAIIKRRAASRGACASGERITLTVNRAARTITFSDTGAGLTESEVHEYLSTIGASDKRELRRQLTTLDTRTGIPIGRFGIGLLSGFIVADRIDVVTRSLDGAALRWTSDGDGSYRVTATERDAVGTSVTLHLREEHDHYLDAEDIGRLVRRYANIIGVPVYIGRDASPVNAVHAPWHSSANGQRQDRAEYATFWATHFPECAAFETIPLDDSVAWVDAEGVPQTAAVRGVLAIADRSFGAADTRGSVDLFVARMFIASDVRTVLPDWASFVRGVVECDALEPNAARDAVLPTPALEAVRQALGRAIVARLIWLAREEPTRLHDVLTWHGIAIMLACLRAGNDDFFDAVAELVPFEEEAGPVTLREYLRTAERLADGRARVFYVPRASSRAQYALLGAASGHRVLHASSALEEPFLVRYAARRSTQVVLVRLDQETSELFRDADEETIAALAPVTRALRRIALCEVRVSHFAPATQPLIVDRSSDAERFDRLRDVMEDPATPPYMRAALEQVVAGERPQIVVHVNAGNATLHRLASRGRRLDAVALQALRALYHLALLTHARTLGAETVRIACAEQLRLVEMAVEITDRAGINSEVPSV